MLSKTIFKLALNWTNQNGFTFYFDKCKVLHLTLLPTLQDPPRLHINNINIGYVNEFKFLGLIWDEKVIWKAHIGKIRDNCRKMEWMLRSVSSNEWGVDQHILLHMYKLFVRSKN